MKTEHIQKQLDFFVRDKSHHAYRKPAEDVHALAAEFAAQGLDDMQRSVARLRYVLVQETPVVFPDERITLLRTVRTIPEIHTEEDEWYCNRLVNEALLETKHHGKGPVHINVPVSEPLFNFTTEALPQVRVITRYQGLNVYDRDYNELIDRMNKYRKRMIVVDEPYLSV